MASVLNYSAGTSSNSSIQLHTLGGSSLFSTLKLPTTFIIQPPQPNQNKSSTLLTKRCKASELGDLLMKKIKTKMISTGEDSTHQSPTIKEDNVSETQNLLESTSMIEDVASPSIKSNCEEIEKHNDLNILAASLIPQRSISTPLLFNSFNLKSFKSGASDGHKQVQHALETLQKKMLMQQQAASLKEILLKVQFSHEPLVIPPLLSSSNSTQSSVTHNRKKQEGVINSTKLTEDGSDVFYGPVEYPLLSMGGPNADGDNTHKALTKNNKSNVEYLCLTRSETQRSASDDVLSMSEDLSQSGESRKRKTKKTSNKKADPRKGKTTQKKGKEQAKSQQEKKEEATEICENGRRTSERRKNKWQLEQAEKQSEERKLINSASVLIKRSEMDGDKLEPVKASPLSLNEGELNNFFESLGNLLNINVNQEKAIKMLKENYNNIQSVLESVKTNSTKYIQELAN